MILVRWTTGHRCLRLPAPRPSAKWVFVPAACPYGAVTTVNHVQRRRSRRVSPGQCDLRDRGCVESARVFTPFGLILPLICFPAGGFGLSPGSGSRARSAGGAGCSA